MSGIPTLPYFPPSFDAGSSILYGPTFENYPSSEWTTAHLFLSFGTLAPTDITGTVAANDAFLFTISSSATATLTPGQWRWTVKLGNGTYTETPILGQGTTTILPNYALQQTATLAETQLALINEAISQLMANPLQSTNFNGQSMSMKDMKQLRDWQVQAQAAVLREQQAINRARGGCDPGRIQVRFDGFQIGPPFPPFGYPYPAVYPR